ncbi:MAG: GNAT family N-acetyltransferase [Pseudomonadota bacterium]
MDDASALTITLDDPQSPVARACLKRYYDELNARFSHGFDVSLSRDPEARVMQPPVGAFLIAMRDGYAVGCVGLKGPGPVAEVKRLWIDPDARGLGIAKALMAEVEARAAQLGIETLRLDTNSALHEALSFYRNAGWREIPRYNANPYAHVFFEKSLRPR